MSEFTPIFTGQELSIESRNWLDKALTAAQRAGVYGYLKGGVLRDYISNFYNGTNLSSKDLDIMFTNGVNWVTKELRDQGAEIVARRNRKKTPVFELSLPAQSGTISADIGILLAKPNTYGRNSTVESLIYDDATLGDFTINALFLPLGNALNVQNIIDPLNGIEDIRNRMVRMVAPNTFVRNCECMLRAVRMADKLSATIESVTYDAIKYYSPLIKKAPKPVVDQNMSAIMGSPNREENIDLLRDLNLLQHLEVKDLL